MWKVAKVIERVLMSPSTKGSLKMAQKNKLYECQHATKGWSQGKKETKGGT